MGHTTGIYMSVAKERIIENIKDKKTFLIILTIFWWYIIFVKRAFNMESLAGCSNWTVAMMFMAYGFTIIASYVCCLMVNKLDEKSFLVIAVLLGGIMIFANPFVHIMDESTHYFRSFAISEGQWIDIIDENGEIGAIMPENYYKFQIKLTLKTVIENQDFFGESYSDTNAFSRNPYMSSVLPTNHAIAAVGIFLANLFNAPIWVVMWVSRIFDLAVYIILCYWAIKIAKYYKSFYFVSALLPMSIWLAASCSQDPIVNGATMLFISICLKYKWGDEQYVSKLDTVAILMCGFSIASVKYLVYSPVLLLFFVIPKEKFKKNQRGIMIALAIIIVIVCVAGQFYLLDKFPYKEDRNGDVDMARQIAFILDSPIAAFRIFTEYVSNHVLWHLENFWYESATGLLCQWAGIFGIAAAPVLAKDKYQWKEEDKKKERGFSLLMIFIVSVVTILTVIALYLGFTPVAKPGVDGLQTRYFIPVLFPIMYLLSKLDVINNIKKYELMVANIMMLGILDMIAKGLLDTF